jgi:hypothetical protein
VIKVTIREQLFVFIELVFFIFFEKKVKASILPLKGVYVPNKLVFYFFHHQFKAFTCKIVLND